MNPKPRSSFQALIVPSNRISGGQDGERSIPLEVTEYVTANRETFRLGKQLLARGEPTRAFATSFVHTASPPPPSRAPAGSRASNREASIAPRTASVRGPPASDAPRARTHRSSPAPSALARAARRPRTVHCPAPA